MKNMDEYFNEGDQKWPDISLGFFMILMGLLIIWDAVADKIGHIRLALQRKLVYWLTGQRNYHWAVAVYAWLMSLYCLLIGGLFIKCFLWSW